MTQFDLDTPINPNTKSGSVLASDLSAWRDAINSCHAGTSRPAYAVAGMFWRNTSGTPWVVYMYDGSDDIAVGTVNATTNKFIPGASALDVFTDIKQIATTISMGVAELATPAEALAGVEASKICTPEGLASNQTIATNGYTELPGGLIMQWGKEPEGTIAGNAASTGIIFDYPFSTNLFSLTCTAIGETQGGGQSDYWGVFDETKTGFTIKNLYDGSKGAYWIALGN